MPLIECSAPPPVQSASPLRMVKLLTMDVDKGSEVCTGRRLPPLQNPHTTCGREKRFSLRVRFFLRERGGGNAFSP